MSTIDRCRSGCQVPAAISPLGSSRSDVVEFGVAPHQAQAAADGLFQQDLRAAGATAAITQMLLTSEALARHQHDDHPRLLMPVHVRQALAQRH